MARSEWEFEHGVWCKMFGPVQGTCWIEPHDYGPDFNEVHYRATAGGTTLIYDYFSESRRPLSACKREATKRIREGLRRLHAAAPDIAKAVEEMGKS